MGLQNVSGGSYSPRQSLNKRLHEGLTKEEVSKKRSNNLNSHFGLADFDKNNVLDKFEIIRYDLITKRGMPGETARFTEALNILRQNDNLTQEDKALIKKYEQMLNEISTSAESNKQKLLNELNIKEEDLTDKWPDMNIRFDQYGHLHSTDNKLRIDMGKEVACHKNEYQMADWDNNNKLDAFEIFRYNVKTLYPDKSDKEVMQEALEAYKYASVKFLHRSEKEVNYAVNLIRHYEQIIKDSEEKSVQEQSIPKENVSNDSKPEKLQENVSFFDERWTGHTIAKLTGDNFITDWLQDKDKVCTDGCDDGKIGFWEGAKSFAKGLIGGIPKVIVNHPLATAVTAGLGAGAVALTGGAILPVLGAIGVVTGVGMMGYGGYKAATAKTDGEAKQALETMGIGVTTTALSMASAGKTLEKAAEAGVKSAEISKDANVFQKTVQMFKASPEALKLSWKNAKINMGFPVEYTYKTHSNKAKSQTASSTKPQTTISSKTQKALKKFGIEKLHIKTVQGKNMILGYTKNDGTYIQIKPVLNSEKEILQIISKLSKAKSCW